MYWGGPDPWVKAPVIPGHEFFGTVVDVGEGATEAHGVVPGDLAVAEQIYPCQACRVEPLACACTVSSAPTSGSTMWWCWRGRARSGC